MARVRRTQAERSAATRAALLAATVDTLVERGYHGTTTSEVARRAGVSYGALLHHFPAKADLLCAAVGHLFEQRTEEFRTAMAALPEHAAKGPAAIDLLWRMFRGPTFTAWLELWLAARTEPELTEAVARVDRRFLESSQDVFRELFAAEARANPELPAQAVGLTYAFLDGLALSQLVPGCALTSAEDLLAVFKALVTTALPSPQETP